MYTFLGNTMNKIYNNGDIRLDSFVPVDVKRAQFVLNNSDDFSKKHWNDLCKLIYKAVLRSTLQIENHLENVTKVIIDWNSEVANKSLLDVRRLFMERKHEWAGVISNLSGWQKEFIQLLKNDKNIVNIWGFNDADVDTIWIIVKDASTKKVLEYNQLFFEVLDHYPDVDCDFMVYNEKEIAKINKPNLLYFINL